MPLNGNTQSNNILYVAAAGAGKTRLLIEDALKSTEDTILITTYTESNALEIASRIKTSLGYIPSNITVLPWFSFLLAHGARPYQNILNEELHEKRLGFYLTNTQSGTFVGRNGKTYTYGAEGDFYRHYFTSKESLKIYSDKIAKFTNETDEKLRQNRLKFGRVIGRISRIFSRIYIDEVQDLAGYDLELIRKLLSTPSIITMVGDPRQVTYLTHNPSKNKKYKDGGIDRYIKEEVAAALCKIDYSTLNVSHRNNSNICKYSSRLYPDFDSISACNCAKCNQCDVEHQGVFLVRKKDINLYLNTYKPTILRYKEAISPEWNFGKSKGMTFPRVLIYPTKDIENWIFDNSTKLEYKTRCKFYVAITRAQYSVGIISNRSGAEGDINIWTP